MQNNLEKLERQILPAAKKDAKTAEEQYAAAMKGNAKGLVVPARETISKAIGIFNNMREKLTEYGRKTSQLL